MVFCRLYSRLFRIHGGESVSHFRLNEQGFSFSPKCGGCILLSTAVQYRVNSRSTVLVIWTP